MAELFGVLTTCAVTCTDRVVWDTCSTGGSVSCDDEPCELARTCSAVNCIHPPED